MTCCWPTVVLLTAALWLRPLLVCCSRACGWRWGRGGNRARTRNHGGEGVWAREGPRASAGFASHFVWDAVAAFVTVLSVPRVAWRLAAGLLLVKLQNRKGNKTNLNGAQVGDNLSCTLEHVRCTQIYLMHVERMDAHFSGGVLWKHQTGELTLPGTAAWAHSPSISPSERRTMRGNK